MADHFYSVVLGENTPDKVTVGTSTSSESIELRVTDAVAGLTGNKLKLLNGLEAIRQYIIRDNAPA